MTRGVKHPRAPRASGTLKQADLPAPFRGEKLTEEKRSLQPEGRGGRRGAAAPGLPATCDLHVQLVATLKVRPATGGTGQPGAASRTGADIAHQLDRIPKQIEIRPSKRPEDKRLIPYFQRSGDSMGRD